MNKTQTVTRIALVFVAIVLGNSAAIAEPTANGTVSQSDKYRNANEFFEAILLSDE